MSLTFKTPVPQTLLTAFKRAIDDKKIVTWSYDPEGDFTQTPDQWRAKAWLRPEIQDGILCLYVINPRNINITREVYAVYHGRFIEAALAHFDELISDASASALASYKDMIAA